MEVEKSLISKGVLVVHQFRSYRIEVQNGNTVLVSKGGLNLPLEEPIRLSKVNLGIVYVKQTVLEHLLELLAFWAVLGFSSDSHVVAKGNIVGEHVQH